MTKTAQIRNGFHAG